MLFEMLMKALTQVLIAAVVGFIMDVVVSGGTAMSWMLIAVYFTVLVQTLYFLGVILFNYEDITFPIVKHGRI